MKLKFKLLILVLGLSILAAQAREYTRNEHGAYPRNQIQALEITNKFGTITINDFGGDSVVVDAVITVENATENKAEYLLTQIDINIQRVGSTLKVETKIHDDFKTKQNFSIDYTINIPPDRDLTVSNKFGNVVVNNLNANGLFDLSYGNINTGDLKAPANRKIRMNIAYGKADIGSINRMESDLKYSKLFIGSSGTMTITSKYSGINVEEVEDLTLESKYDGVEIGALGNLKANSKYTNYKVKELHQSLLLDTQYGSVRVEKVSGDFEHIELTNSYGGIEIGLGDANYLIDATCDYCDVKYPSGSFVGNREKNNQNLHINGTVGSVANKRVIIKSRYGGVKLTN